MFPELADVGPVVVFGNSIAEGFIDGEVDTLGRYSNLLRNELSISGYEVEVRNSGRGGDTTRDGYSRLDSDVLRFEPRVVTISFGPNDYYITEDGRPRVEVEEFSLYLRSIIDRISDEGAQPILLSLVPVIPDLFYNTHNRELYEPLGGIEVVWLTYDNAVRQAGKEKGVDVVDLFPAFNDSLELLLGEDGGHPNQKGHQTIANLLLSHVVSALEAIRSDNEGGKISDGGIQSLSLYPNPFQPEQESLFRIAYEAVEEGRVTIEVYNSSGRRVATPVKEIYRLPGSCIEFWDGNSSEGKPLASGIYIVKIDWSPTSGEKSRHLIGKVAILR